MKELERILQLWKEAERNGEAAVLATVVKTQGSSYRLPGARLLLTASGKRAGSVSGGCLEQELVKKAWWFTERGPVVRRYDTTPDGEIAAEYGLGCNGIIHVLLERLAPGEPTVLDLIRDVRAQRRSAVVAHWIAPASAVGQRMTIDQDDDSALARVQAEGEVFIETLVPAVRLLVFGAGEDAIPLVDLAKSLGWQVSVFDGRAHYARREKFPAADEVAVRPAGESAGGLGIDPWTVAVLMSHSYSQDLDNLRELAGQPLRYLGILGPRKRTSQLLEEAGLDGTKIPASLHSPVGLDIGADGPEQVALAVIAEIQAVLNGRQGGSLRERAGSIHAPEEESSDPARAWVRSIACA